MSQKSKHVILPYYHFHNLYQVLVYRINPIIIIPFFPKPIPRYIFVQLFLKGKTRQAQWGCMVPCINLLIKESQVMLLLLNCYGIKATKTFILRNWAHPWIALIPFLTSPTTLRGSPQNLSPATWHLGDTNSKELLAHNHTRCQE